MVAWSRSIAWLVCGWVLFSATLQPAAAQSPTPDGFHQPAAYDPPSGTVLPFSGTSIIRRGELISATSDAPLITGDRLHTTSGGSAMIVLVEHSVIFLSEQSELELRGPQRLRLLRGHAVAMVEDWPRVLSIEPPANGVLLTIDVPDGAITSLAAGDYEIDVEPLSEGVSSVVLSVQAGRARIASVWSRASASTSASGLTGDRRETSDLARSLEVSTGQAALLRRSEGPWAIAPSPNPHRRIPEAMRLSLMSLRGFRERAPAMYASLPAAQHLYAWLLEAEGSWVMDRELGRYWMPRVDDGWQPFTNGSWVSVPAFGWTWTSGDRFWGWLTHHYGRWQLDQFGRWGWMPGQEWSPGWVTWANAPDYVAWCPLGWDDYPVFDFSSDYWYDGLRSDGHRWSWSYSRRHRDARVVRPEHGRRPLPETAPIFAFQPSRYGRYSGPSLRPRPSLPAPGAEVVSPRLPVNTGDHTGAVPRSSLSPGASTGAVPRAAESNGAAGAVPRAAESSGAAGAVPRATESNGSTGAIPRAMVPNSAGVSRSPAAGEGAVPRHGSLPGGGSEAMPATDAGSRSAPRETAVVPSGGGAVPRHGSLAAAEAEAARRDPRAAREAQAAREAEMQRRAEELAAQEAATTPTAPRDASPAGAGAVPRNDSFATVPSEPAGAPAANTLSAPQVAAPSSNSGAVPRRGSLAAAQEEAAREREAQAAREGDLLRRAEEIAARERALAAEEAAKRERREREADEAAARERSAREAAVAADRERGAREAEARERRARERHGSEAAAREAEARDREAREAREARERAVRDAEESAAREHRAREAEEAASRERSAREAEAREREARERAAAEAREARDREAAEARERAAREAAEARERDARDAREREERDRHARESEARARDESSRRAEADRKAEDDRRAEEQRRNDDNRRQEEDRRQSEQRQSNEREKAPPRHGRTP